MKNIYQLTRSNLRGIWAGLITPWDENFNLREECLAQEVRNYAADGLHGVYTGGTTGEYYAQDDETYRRITRIVCKTGRDANIPVQIGCTALSSRTVALRIRIACDEGTNGLQLALPFWLELKDDEVLCFFDACVKAAGDTPIILYNTDRSKKKLKPDMLGKLAQQFPTFIGIKDGGSIEHLKAILAEVPDLSVFGGEDDLFLKMQEGGTGAYSAWCGLNAEIVVRLYELCAEGNWEEAQPYDEAIQRLLEGILPLVKRNGLLDSAIDRMVRVLGGSDVGIRCAEPYRSATPAQLEDFRQWIETYAAEWFASKPKNKLFVSAHA